jgi:hypothetical protein
MDDNNIKNQDGLPKNLPDIEHPKEQLSGQFSKEEKYDVTHAPTPHVFKVQKSPAKIILTSLLIILLAVGCGYLGYLYLQEKDNANNLKQQVNKLKSQTSVPESNSAEVAVQAENETVSYTAEVGKFTLTLPKDYVIIKNIDGGYEGGPVTELEIGEATSNPGVIIGTEGLTTFKIRAIPNQGGDLESFINEVLYDWPKDQQTEKETIKIGNINAKVIGVEGLSVSEYIFFENEGINYYIELSDSKNEKIKLFKQEVISGFKFN